MNTHQNPCHQSGIVRLLKLYCTCGNFMHSVHYCILFCAYIGWLRGLRKNPPSEDVSSLVFNVEFWSCTNSQYPVVLGDDCKSEAKWDSQTEGGRRREERCRGIAIKLQILKFTWPISPFLWNLIIIIAKRKGDHWRTRGWGIHKSKRYDLKSIFIILLPEI